jgi:hypothetical protein
MMGQLMTNPENNTQTSEAVEQQFIGVCDRIDKGIEVLDSGGIIDMKFIETSVRELCASIQGLQVEEAKAYLPRLKALMQHLEDISKRLLIQKQLVESDLETLDGKSGAVNAYNHAAKLGTD